jgi:hypothetical protein
MIGDANVTEISPDGTMKRLDCVLVSGETRDGTVLAIMTPYFRENGNLQLGNSQWFNSKEKLASIVQANMFKGIFK